MINTLIDLERSIRILIIIKLIAEDVISIRILQVAENESAIKLESDECQFNANIQVHLCRCTHILTPEVSCGFKGEYPLA